MAAEIGYPVMLKAAAGGGGKGMRLVHTPADLKSRFENARSEAQRAFGDDEVYIEKAIINPRHIEMQVFGDEHGNVVYLGERECSVQRRHQKVLEEAPSPIVDQDMRRRMGEVAVRVAKAAGYTNAGTVEFLVDQQKNFYFLEMNTRLQVEHPVTELVTGLDLVHLQIAHRCRRAAAVHSRKTSSCAATPSSAASTPKIPTTISSPRPGKITRLISPSGPGIRRDSGMYEGWTVPIDYDPLLAKLIGYGADRAQAIAAAASARCTSILSAASRPTFRCSGAFCRTRISARATSTPASWTGCWQPRSVEHNPQHELIATIAAGIFATMDPTGDFPRRRWIARPGQRRRRSRAEQLAPHRPRRRACERDDLRRNR